jgi:hypothetical protein
VYSLVEVTECCWSVVDRDGNSLHINPNHFETIRDVTGDTQYALTVGD